ncbi:MAG: glycosyl hydrolase [Bacteroidota bacterium]
MQEDSALHGLTFRCIGPFRGGRSAAVTGVPGNPNLYYFGAAGGGVWRTEDGGNKWKIISDGYFGGSIGAVAVSESDPNVIYVGGGEKTLRGNVSFGYGIWKSTDAGATWTKSGLPNSRHIPRIRIHPKNPEVVYAAVLGDLYKSSEERGVYRSIDGGKTWQQVLFSNKDAGAVDLLIDPHNSRVLYASTWRARRTPYDFSSGGEGSGLWRSTDRGDTWELLSDKKGMPKGPLGIIGITVSPAKRGRLWAIVEAPEGGVFRSDDGGDTWARTNQSRALRQRAWYYSRIYADPQNEDKVYVVNVRYHTSTDGGKTFTPRRAPHGDHHDLWIDPMAPNRMIIGDDGGAQVTADGGSSWTTYENQPTAQFYRVTTDNHFPFRIYAAQQDNTTLRIAHRTNGGSIGERDWETTAGGESAHIAIDPENQEIVYGGSYGGFLTRKDHTTDQTRAINVWPDNPLGHGAEGMKYRFQWNFPIFFSPHDAKKLYAASNQLHVSTDEGQSWQTISPDLTRNDSAKLVSSGGPITKDNTGVEYYCTIFAAAESPLEPGVIWCGSDDGLIHLTQNRGKDWRNVTPSTKLLPEWTQINSIEIHPTEKGGLYLAATAYKWGNYQPYLLKTLDYGKTWQRIDEGIPAEHFTRVIRADPSQKGLLYAGTESGVYISYNDGNSWQPFQLNLPTVPITDMTIKEDHLIVATQGRSLWVLDDLPIIRQLSPERKPARVTLYQPKSAYRMPGYRSAKPSLLAGTNHHAGASVYAYFPEALDSTAEVSLEFLTKAGEVIRTYTPDAEKTSGNRLAPIRPGMNRFGWDLRYPTAKKFEGMVLWWAQLEGPKVVPDTYQVRLVVGTDTQTQELAILKDPRVTTTAAGLQAQFDFLMENQEKMTEAHTAIEDIRTLRPQLQVWEERTQDKEEMTSLNALLDSTLAGIQEVEEALYQTQNRSPQDPLNFPIRLTNKLGHVASLTSMSDYPPTAQAQAVQAEMIRKIDEQLSVWYSLQETVIPQINQMLLKQQVKVIGVKNRAHIE